MLANLWAAFSRTVAQRAEMSAIVRPDNTATFRQWNERVRDFAAAFQKIGIRKGDRVLIWVSNSTDIAAAILAIWACDGIVVFMDSTSPEAHFRHAIDKTQPIAVVHCLTDSFLWHTEGFSVIYCDDVPRCSAEVTHTLSARALPTDAASIVFTSGSTGRPKGVVQSHGNLLRGCQAVASYLGLTPDDRILCPVSWAFDYGYGQLISTLVLGPAQVLPVSPNPFATCSTIAQCAPTVLAGVPSFYTYLIHGVTPIHQTDTSSLRLLTSSGGRIPVSVLADIRRLFSHCRIVLNYGLTETYRSCYLDPKYLDTHQDTIGKPIPGVDVVIVREDGTLADVDETGEIVHRGDYICLGYWADAEATALAIRPDPVAIQGQPNPGRALFTGDYGFFDKEGFLHYQGRRDHLLKSMGVRVNPGEVEELFYGSGLLEEIAVFGVQHDLLGHEIWAAVVPKHGVTQKQLEQFAKTNLSVFMLPRRYLIKDSLPKTPTRKTDYVSLRVEAVSNASRSFA